MDESNGILAGSDEDEEVETMTSAELLKKLEDAWLNEKFSPDLLENRSEIVECMMDQVSQMEDNITKARKGDFKVSIHRMEIDRIRYVLSSYLRTRLEKIEKFTAYIMNKEKDKDPDDCKLTPEEMAYAKEYHENMMTHYKNLALSSMPPNLQSMAYDQTAVEPNRDSYVFLKVNEDTDGVLVEEETVESREEVVDFEASDQHIMRYQPIAGLVNSGAVSLM